MIFPSLHRLHFSWPTRTSTLFNPNGSSSCHTPFSSSYRFALCVFLFIPMFPGLLIEFSESPITLFLLRLFSLLFFILNSIVIFSISCLLDISSFFAYASFWLLFHSMLVKFDWIIYFTALLCLLNSKRRYSIHLLLNFMFRHLYHVGIVKFSCQNLESID